MTNETHEWWTPAQLARRWQVSVDTVLRMIGAGDIIGQKFGARYRVHNSAVEKFEQDGKAKPRSVPRVRVAFTADSLGIYGPGTPPRPEPTSLRGVPRR